jgi:hypothetical protein
MRNTLVVRRKTLSLTTVTAAEGTRDARRLLIEEIIVFFQNEGLGVVCLSSDDGALERGPVLRETSRSGALALLTSFVVVVVWIVVVCLMLIIVLRDTEIVKAVKLEVAVVGLSEVNYNSIAELCTYIVIRLGSVKKVVVIIQVFLKIGLAKRLIAYKVVSVIEVGKAHTKVLTIEYESLIRHVVDCGGGDGGDMYSVGTVQ